MPDMPSTKKKRKLKSTEKKQKPPKTHRIDGLHKPNEVEESESSKRQELEVASPWRNLQLILSIQKKDIELQRKVELALEYVNCKLKGGDDDTSETLRQQKDVFGRYCFNFLCDFIWVYSGYGPLKSGIKREVDEALRPGVYALLDTCSLDDFQYLHTAFGEVPCRNTLAMLQHDYKLNFQYEGKV